VPYGSATIPNEFPLVNLFSFIFPCLVLHHDSYVRFILMGCADPRAPQDETSTNIRIFIHLPSCPIRVIACGDKSLNMIASLRWGAALAFQAFFQDSIFVAEMLFIQHVSLVWNVWTTSLHPNAYGIFPLEISYLWCFRSSEIVS